MEVMALTETIIVGNSIRNKCKFGSQNVNLTTFVSIVMLTVMVPSIVQGKIDPGIIDSRR